MPVRYGAPELIILLLIIILLFGLGRISKIVGELGKGIRLFREGLQEPEYKNESESENTTDKIV